MPPAPIPEILTHRLRLRAFTPEDAPEFHAAYGDPVAMRHWNHAPSPDIERTARYIRGWTKANPKDAMIWAIALGDTDRCIGMVNYHTRNARSFRVEIGYILAPQAAGQGYATEALTAFIGHLHTALHVHRIEAQIEPENVKSRALVERLGFILEAPLLRDRWKIGDAYRSVAMYALVTT